MFSEHVLSNLNNREKVNSLVNARRNIIINFEVAIIPDGIYWY